MFATMPLGLSIHNNWDGISMATPPLHSLRMERPAYSTPAPVENTPSNNECRMVELRGAKIASFIVGGEEFICLPQAFDLFLKHLVGGLHTVYTKLKRLSIAPVVCNVEQVRILRGIGAIQPGVNRCKLITRKDFETLYQDCTTATRPGRPPKRYPMLPPTSDYLAHHSSLRNSGGSHGLLNPSDFSSLHKRMRLDNNADKLQHAFQDRRRASCSPPSVNDGMISDKEVSLPTAQDLHSNPTTNFYLQAVRQQFQQANSGLHNGLEAQQAAAAAAGINPALAPLVMMSHPALFSTGLPPSSISMLNHVNQLAQSHNATMSSAAAAAVAQMAASGGNMHPAAAAAQAMQVAASFAAAHGASENRDANSDHANDEKDSDSEIKQNVAANSSGQNVMTNGIGSDGRASPESSLSDGGISNLSDNSENGMSVRSESAESAKDASNNTVNGASIHDDGNKEQSVENLSFDHYGNDGDNMKQEESEEDRMTQQNSFGSTLMSGGGAGQSSMQNLLTNIQGLLKVAADNARLQEKHKSFEIADLKIRLSKERQIREELEKKVQQLAKTRDDALKRYKKERKSRKYLQEQLAAIRPQKDRASSKDLSNNASSPPPSSDAESIRSLSRGVITPPASTKSYVSPPIRSPTTTSADNTIESGSPPHSNVPQSEHKIASATSPLSIHSTSSTPKHSIMGENINNNNRSSSLSRLSSSSEHMMTSDSSIHSRNSSTSHESQISVSMEAHDRSSTDHLPLSAGSIDSRMYFKTPVMFQNAVSQ